MKSVAEQFDFPYIEQPPLPLDLIGSDKIHPTDAGHKRLAQIVGARLKQLGLPRRDAFRK